MDLPEEVKGKERTEDAGEAWFLESLGAVPMPSEAMMKRLAELVSDGQVERAREWAELMQESLSSAEGDHRAAGLSLLGMRANWPDVAPDFAKTAHESLAPLFADRLGKALVASAGFDQGLPVGECLRRLDLLSRLVPGTYCHDRTWGFGIVRRLDDFYRKVTIDFHRKPAHQMTFAYAAETLELIGNDHLFVRRHTESEAFTRTLADNPAEIVRMAIRSYGPMSAPMLKDLLVPEFLPESDWKRFWDAARVVLKADPLVDLPAKRNDPIRLLHKEKDFGSDWRRDLKAERDPETILRMLGDFQRDGEIDALSEDARAVVGERLAFVFLAAQGVQPDLLARAVLMACRFGVAKPEGAGDADPRPDVRRATDRLLEPGHLLDAGANLPVRELRPFVDHLAAFDQERAVAVMIDLLPRMSLALLSETLEWMTEHGRLAACAARIEPLFLERAVSGQILYWLCRWSNGSGSWSAIQRGELLASAVEFLASAPNGDALKAQNLLRALFEQPSWIEAAIEPLTLGQRHTFFMRINQARTWDIGSRRSVMARMIKYDPRLQEAFGTERDPGPAVAPSARVTSWRSYRERQQQLKELVEVTIPQNSRDIGVARSYGDLRENFEYQAARDQQKLLLRREAELNADLAQVRGTDFDGFPTDRGGPGTMVVIRRPNGSMETICILGEWDRDEHLGIISSQSRLGQRLEGVRAHDDVTLPSSDAVSAGADEVCRIVEVTGLSDAIKSWVRGV